MKKMQRIFALFLCALTLLPLLAGCAQPATGDELTRRDWIGLLCERFSVADSATAEPYFEDIAEDDELFGKIQACVELGILKAEKSFRGQDAVSAKEAGLACVEAIGRSTVAAYRQSDGDPTDKEALAFAREQIFPNLSDGTRLTRTQAEEALNRAATLLMQKPLHERDQMELAEGAVDLRNAEVAYTADKATLPEDAAAEVGSIVVLPPSAEYPAGLARKVVSLSGREAELGEAEMEDVFTSLQVAKRTELTRADFTPAEGVSFAEDEQGEALSRKTTAGLTPLAAGKKLGFEVEVNLTKGKLSVGPKWGSLSGSAEQKPAEDDTIRYEGKTPYTAKYEKGYEIKGKISLSDISMDSEVDYRVPFGIKRCEARVNFKAALKLSIKGKLTEDIEILTATIPLGGVLAAKCVFLLSLDGNGEISVKSEVTNTTTFLYEKGLRQINENRIENKAEIKAEGKVMVGPKAVLTALGIDLADVQGLIGLGIQLEISAEQGTTELPCLDLKVYAPIVTLKLGADTKTVLHKMGIKAEWKVYDIKDGWKTSPVIASLHYEAGRGFVKACTHPSDEPKAAAPASPAISEPAGTGENTSPAEPPEADIKPDLYWDTAATWDWEMAFVFGNQSASPVKADELAVSSVRINGIECEIFQKCSGEENVRQLFDEQDGNYEALTENYNKYGGDLPIAFAFVATTQEMNDAAERGIYG